MKIGRFDGHVMNKAFLSCTLLLTMTGLHAAFIPTSSIPRRDALQNGGATRFRLGERSLRPLFAETDDNAERTIEKSAGDVGHTVLSLASSVSAASSILWKYNTVVPSSNKKSSEGRVNAILELCDEMEDGVEASSLSHQAMKYARYSSLQSLMSVDYDAYVKLAKFASPDRIPREELPNVQDIPVLASVTALTLTEDTLVPDCALPNATFAESLLDTVLLSVFRKLVEKNSGGVAASSQPGILGLLDQGRIFMLSGATPETQHTMVRSTLGDLMTPVLPPVFRLFMSGILPDRVARRLDAGPDYRPLGGAPFYAHYFTTVVTPLFFNFLVGPSRPNARKDGKAGGLLVEKCKFLQESNCKGMCLHICKLPTQQFFKDELGMDLTVSPNFETQECQWSFGEEAKPYEEDDSFPKGCIVGCGSREFMKGAGTSAKGTVLPSCG